MPSGSKKGGFQHDREFTLMIVPHSGGRVVSIRVKPAWVKAAYGAIGVTVLVTSLFAVKYRQMSRMATEVGRLRVENAQQKSQLEALTEEAAVVRERLRRLEELDREIRDLVERETSVIRKQGTTDLSRAREANRLSYAEVSRGGASRHLTGFSFLAEEARQREVSLTQVKQAVVEMVEFLRAKPALLPVNGNLTSRFGWRRSPITGGKERHQGLDIAAPYGAVIKAPGAGKVVFAGYRAGFGKTVILDHGYGIRTMYGHCQKLLVNAGQEVQRGQSIATVGSSGRSTGPHLHFEISVNGKPVDPETFIIQ